MRKPVCVAILISFLGTLPVHRVDAAESRPYRVLVVIGDQWNDPGSYYIDDARVRGNDFRDVISMLKVWGIPFDVLRLDQQNLQINRFLNGIIEPNYGCVIWMANPDKLEGSHANYATVRRAVNEYGMSLIALFDYVKAPEISDLIGIEYRDYMVTNQWFKDKRFIVTEDHFVTAGLLGTVLPKRVNVELEPEQLEPMEHMDSSMMWTVLCEARGDAQVLATLGGYPQVVVRDLSDDVKTVWIGGEHNFFERFAELRQVFRNALVWCLGYGVFNDNFDNAILFKMDDMGASEHAYSVGWHYPTPTKEEIIKYLVEPLEENNALIVQCVTPGFANPKTRMVEVPWKREKFVDPFGHDQDYASTKEGLDEGLRRGVFEFHPHRVWTHMTWDLESPPGPWWDAPLEGEMAHQDWYHETYDTRRGKPVPSNEMLFLYRMGRDAVERQFGVTPLAVTIRPQENLATDNGRLAAIAGFGVGLEHRLYFYVGRDYTIQLSMMTPQMHGFHDLDLAYKPELPRRWIELNKDRRWIGFNEMCAFLHSEVTSEKSEWLTIRFGYDAHYCRFFKDHSSSWTLELSDRLSRKLGDELVLVVDGQAIPTPKAQRYTLEISPGVGQHTVVVRPQ